MVPRIYAIRVHSKGPFSGREERMEPYVNPDGQYTLAPRPKTALDRPGNRVLTPDPHEVVRLLRTDAYCLVMRGRWRRKHHLVQPYDITVEGTDS
ncbi:hypothetical protein D3273_22245 [Lichenibacterium minor]|uniref:Uncharacterized protein n=1 Tax=Lichenibacterium minor TaxID=2316528 RepID=A0A4Q2U4E7_9HYPH|nr:hypothetical protein [Lichenibacterium minor]RYC29787.1 hypothetical protein D3273_22245 [Lichenibacterium minor]